MMRPVRYPTATANTALAAWRARLGLTQRAAAAALGMTLRGYQEQERGAQFTSGEPRTASRVLLLACAAIERGIGPIG